MRLQALKAPGQLLLRAPIRPSRPDPARLPRVHHVLPTAHCCRCMLYVCVCVILFPYASAGYGRLDLLKLLLQRGADTGAANKQKQTPADVARLNGEVGAAVAGCCCAIAVSIMLHHSSPRDHR